MLVMPQPLHEATVSVAPTPTAIPTVIMTATPSATPVITATPSITVTPTPTATPKSVQSIWPKPVANPLSYSMVVNKKYVLASTFVPPDLRSVMVPHTNNHPLRTVAADALENMVGAAAADGVQLRLLSGYRSYATQKSLYNNYVANYGRAAADRFSARPGHSEHQSGLTLDIGDATAPGCDIAACFATTAGGQWVATHAAEFGYIVRYTAAKESITGYMAEPWHIRYVGVDLAQKVAASGLCLEEYLGVEGGGYEL